MILVKHVKFNHKDKNHYQPEQPDHPLWNTHQVYIRNKSALGLLNKTHLVTFTAIPFDENIPEQSFTKEHVTSLFEMRFSHARKHLEK